MNRGQRAGAGGQKAEGRGQKMAVAPSPDSPRSGLAASRRSGFSSLPSALCALPSALLLALLLLAGCGLFKRVPNQFYALDTLPAEGARAPVAGAPIGLDTIELPPGIDRRGIVVRGANHELEVRGTHQWASPLEEMVIHTLAFDLANRLPEAMMVLPGQPKPSAARSLSVTFEDLAPGPDRVFVLDARWTLASPGAAEVSRHERITIPLESTESPAIVAAMSRALATLADRIVAAM